MRPARCLVVTALAIATGAAGYHLGKGEDPGLAILKSRPKRPGAAKEAPPAQVKSRESTAATIERLYRADPTGWVSVIRYDAWESIRTFGSGSCREGLEALAKYPPQDGSGQMQEMLLARWAALDPEAALLHAVGNKLSPGPVLCTWVRDDPEAAYRWSLKNPELAQQHGFARMVANSLSMEPPASAIKKASLMGKGYLDAVISAVAMTAGASGHEAREEYLESLLALAPDSREEGMKALVRSWAAVDPEAALAKWDAHELTDSGPKSTKTMVLRHWAEKDAVNAFAWINQHPGFTDHTTLRTMYGPWWEEDPDAARTWLEAYPKRGEFAADLARQTVADAERSSGATERLKQLRREAFSQYYRIWHGANPEEALRWRSSLNRTAASALLEDS